ncbi:MAG: MarR family transcriptional regulator [Bdellovibrionales bacterium]|nr:MarR family transcriptional regulator [Bdellovibrionales bacterium]
MSRRTPAGDAFSLVAVKIMYLNGILLESGDRIASVAGQTSARWRVLAAAEMKLMTVAEIARALSLARQSVQRLADSLTEEGLTTYKDNPNDKRAMHLALTASGRKALTTIQAEQRKWADEVGSHMSVKSLKEIDSTLRELISALEEKPE